TLSPHSFNQPSCGATDTSACPNQKFTCPDLDPRLPPSLFPSSRVNDGICDCCNGLDESIGRCPDRCQHALDTFRENLITRAELHRDGMRLREALDTAGRTIKRGSQQIAFVYLCLSSFSHSLISLSKNNKI